MQCQINCIIQQIYNCTSSSLSGASCNFLPFPSYRIHHHHQPTLSNQILYAQHHVIISSLICLLIQHLCTSDSITKYISHKLFNKTSCLFDQLQFRFSYILHPFPCIQIFVAKAFHSSLLLSSCKFTDTFIEIKIAPVRINKNEPSGMHASVRLNQERRGE